MGDSVCKWTHTPVFVTVCFFYGVYIVILCGMCTVWLWSSIFAFISALFILDHEIMYVIIALNICESFIFGLGGFYERVGTLSSSLTSGESPKPDISHAFLSVVMAVGSFIRAYILFSPLSAALQGTYFYYWEVIYFKMNVALMVNFMTILIQLCAGLLYTIASIIKKSDLRSNLINRLERLLDINVSLFCLVSSPLSMLAMYISYLEIYKFDWRHLINQYLVTKSDDVQEGVSDPIDGSSNTYYFTLCLVIIYAILLFSNVRTIVNKLMKKKEQTKQVGIVHKAPYYQAIPLNLSTV